MEFQKNIYFYFIDYIKAFDCMDHSKLCKIFKGVGKSTTSPASWETCMKIKKQRLEPGMKQQTGSKEGNEYAKAVYCHPAYLTYMWST